MTARHSYSVYGVRVQSDIPFDFPRASMAPDAATVLFSEGADEDFAAFAPVPAEDEFLFLEQPGGAMYLRWAHLYEFSIAADGSRVACRPLEGCDRAVLQNFLFGQVLAVALVRQGLEPLHASVVDLAGDAVAFLGDCTFGKSTLVASFMELGHRLVTDDMLIVERRRGEPHAVPGTGRIKLRPDSAERFLEHVDAGTPLTPSTTKRSFALGDGRRQTAVVPLRMMFVLPTPEEREASTSIEISRVPPSEMARELLKNTFVVSVVDRDRLARQFEAATWLASRVDGFRLRYPAGLRHLPAVRQQIFEYARSLMAQCAS